MHVKNFTLCRGVKRVWDVAAGGSAQVLAKTDGCHATCLNLRESHNQRNGSLDRARIGLQQRPVCSGELGGQSGDLVWGILHFRKR